eukprot:4769481-Pyramimonas_sp.AAC.1
MGNHAKVFIDRLHQLTKANKSVSYKILRWDNPVKYTHTYGVWDLADVTPIPLLCLEQEDKIT